MFSNQLINKLKNATSVAVLTGAGVSAESGVPTFRGAEGLWKKFRPEELANFDAFMKNPELVWEWYNYRRKLIKEVKPNAGHYTLVKFEDYFQDFNLITQNVDNLHRLAGSKNIHELHGNIMLNRCVDCNRYFDDEEFQSKADKNRVPLCTCGSYIRPDVVWYGESLLADVINLAFNVTMQCDVFFTIGTSALVQPAASLPLHAKDSGAYVVEINFESTIISDYVDESILGKSGEILPQLMKQLI